jgi:hypothetical protein
MADLSPADYTARERLKLQMAEAELKALLSGQQVPSFSGSCPTQARQRHQQRLITIKALLDAVTVLTKDL